MIGPFLKSVLVDWWEDNAPRLGSFSGTLFSLSPLLIIAVAVAGLLLSRGKFGCPQGPIFRMKFDKPLTLPTSVAQPRVIIGIQNRASVPQNGSAVGAPHQLRTQ
jgi:hypothetical protein